MNMKSRSLGLLSGLMMGTRISALGSNDFASTGTVLCTSSRSVSGCSLGTQIKFRQSRLRPHTSGTMYARKPCASTSSSNVCEALASPNAIST